MNAECLLQHFDRISEAPDAIPRLRQFILDLAVRGKLVEQDPNDEPAAELLKRIKAEKARLVNERMLREQKPLPSITEEDTDFDLPSGWKWVHMADVVKLWNGYAFKSSDFQSEGIPVIRIGDLQAGKVVLSSAVCVSDTVAKSVAPEVWIPPDALLIAMSGATTGKVAFNCTGSRLLLNQRVGRIEVFLISTQFIRFFFETIIARNLSISFGTAIPNLSARQINQTVVPLPPLVEQHRIVDKVDELMALCDQLEAAKMEREQSRDRLVAASLHRLNSSADTAETDAPNLPARQADAFRAHTRFVFNHLTHLTTRPEHIKQLRQTILNLAVRGKLVPQDSHDEPVAELSKSIGCDDAESAPFSLPDTWKWAKVQEIADTRLGKMLDQAKNKGTERRYLRNVNVRWFDFELSDVLTMRFEEGELEEFSLRVRDVLICEGGEPGRAAVWDGRENNIYFQKAIHRVRFAQGVNPHYFVYVIKESADSGRLAGYFTGVGIKHFTGKGLSSLLVPLPPLAEQHRIVARVDELMALCDQLEAQLITTEADSRRLLEAVLHEALHPAIRPKDQAKLQPCGMINSCQQLHLFLE